MDAITFRFFISLVSTKTWICTYLYESLDNDIYLKIPKGYKMPKAYT